MKTLYAVLAMVVVTIGVAGCSAIGGVDSDSDPAYSATRGEVDNSPSVSAPDKGPVGDSDGTAGGSRHY